MAGSALIVYADSREEVVSILENDAYGHGGVWDVANADIKPTVPDGGQDPDAIEPSDEIGSRAGMRRWKGRE
ncbi:uncharacterized protein Z518_08423 [Rhinocladiella mackenziei CBS 650.93]|uniref:Uncharacterized protein n=1 Tax=Rhinocladiella mackenziei CBS 650.93 TaxID=1442369 RepID=A0A0D2FKN2_9EURO|nr:uncharacterized protein Z518_08423 [Rhinocladiella mackenziei CBS 650.93]KIX02482.1 hypothetical protein Z518_08423 [Rhinocladiella mackenziei CBS 650.93]